MRSPLTLALAWLLTVAPAFAQTAEVEPRPGASATDEDQRGGEPELGTPPEEPAIDAPDGVAADEAPADEIAPEEAAASDSPSAGDGGRTENSEDETSSTEQPLDLTGEAPPPPREVIVEEREEEPPTLEFRFTDERVAGWVIFGSSLLVAIGGGITLAAGLDELNAVENAPFGSDWERFEGAYERAPILTGVGATILGVGLAGLVVGSILLSESGPDGAWIRAAFGPGRATLEGRF